MSFGPSHNQSPFNELPAIVVALAVVIGGIEVMFQLATAGLLGGQSGAGWRINALTQWGLNGEALDWMLARRQFPLDLLAQFLTYPLLHQGFIHALMACVFVLALGNVTAPVLPGWRQVALFFVPSLVAGVVFAILFDGLLFGGFTGAFGLIGAYTYLSRRGLTRIPPESAFLLIGFLLAIQPIFGLASGTLTGWIPDWTAEAVGAATGYALARLLFPGSLQELRDRMRHR
jgi:membrane associated rhomboid family serine protease